MALQRFTIKLTQLRCKLESDSGPSEPYLWVTYFALGPTVPQFQTGPLVLNTPAYDAFRTEFADNVSAGDVVGIPPFLASAHFDMDLQAPGPKLLGAVVILLEEDDTRLSDMVAGRIAYTKEIESQLNALMTKRIGAGDSGPLTDAEKKTIKDAVTSKVEAAVSSGQSAWDVFRYQDDPLGFTYKIFPERAPDQDPNTPPMIVAQTFDFPEVITTHDGWFSDTVTDRYVLSGEVTVGAIPVETIDLCGPQRTALKEKRDEIESLQNRRTALQQFLQRGTPQQKPGIVNEIGATNDLIDQAEADLPALEAALEACVEKFQLSSDTRVVVRDPSG